jgi:Fic/DOC family
MPIRRLLAPEQAGGNKPITVFRGRRLPVPAYPAGYTALIDRYKLPVPLHHEMAAISPKNTRRKEDGWAIYPAALHPGNDAVDHLVFALKYEGVQLLTLKKIFEAFDKGELEAAAVARPTSGYLRRLCYLYEWLIDDRLHIDDVSAGAYVELVDPQMQYTTAVPENDRRFRIRDNLPGTPMFCPVVYRTHRLDAYIERDLSAKARQIVESAPKELIGRAAAFLLLSDSKASFAIEGENPPKDRLARWGYTISKAGQIALRTDTLIRLQQDLIGDDRFVKTGLREEGGFVGRHDAKGQPVPEHISANSEDLPTLLEGLSYFDEFSKQLRFHPVLTAACISFGFVYIHPFEDGNGRIHRFLMHHVLAERKFTPEQIVFPISSVILDDVARYKDVLESVSRPLLEWISWRPTDKGNVDVEDETSDYYRYFDATLHAEFLFKCLERAVETDLPNELGFLEVRDKFHERVTNIVDMGERYLDLLLRFLQQGHGHLSKRAREKEFRNLDEREVLLIEGIFAQLFEPLASAATEH